VITDLMTFVDDPLPDTLSTRSKVIG